MTAARLSPGRPGRRVDSPAMSEQPPVIHSDPEIMGGAPVFVGTRVLFRTLIEYLEAGDPLDVFLDHFPSVSRAQAVAALEQARDLMLEHAHSSR
jgi:uncharacterized protein (DUF433 family)